MYKSLSIVSLVAAVAVAQSTLVPADASDNCKAFLTKLNDDAALAKCTGALSTALAAFAPGADTGSSSAVSTALTSVCGDDVASECPTSVFASQITGFYQACSAELTTAPNPAVVKIYDVLYVVPAMREAICAKDDDGSWCVAAAAPPAGSSASDVQAALFSREGGNVVPNTDAFTRYNVPFLFLTADSPDLCKTCTRNVLNAFIKHESNLPYAPGLTNSQLLNTQSELYAGVQKTCGESFMVSEIAAAGGLGSNGISGVLNGNKSGAMSNVDARFSSLIAAIAGFASFAALF